MRNDVSDPWIYDGAPAVLERAHGTFQVGTELFADQCRAARSQHANAGAVSAELSARAGHHRERLCSPEADPLQFRIQHAREKRLIAVLETVRDASEWQPRTEPAETENGVKRGQGVSAMFRSGTYWACVANIAVDMNSGVIKVEKMTVAVDPGIVINPLQLKRQVEGGAVMGVSIALQEEVQFRRERSYHERLAKLSDRDNGGPSGDQGRSDKPARGGQVWPRI